MNLNSMLGFPVTVATVEAKLADGPEKMATMPSAEGREVYRHTHTHDCVHVHTHMYASHVSEHLHAQLLHTHSLHITFLTSATQVCPIQSCHSCSQPGADAGWCLEGSLCSNKCDKVINVLHRCTDEFVAAWWCPHISTVHHHRNLRKADNN